MSVPQLLEMDYGRTYRFKDITLVLISRSVLDTMEARMVKFMDGAEVSLLDEDGNKVHVCEKLETDDVRFEESHDQTYAISCHSAQGRWVRLETSKKSPMNREILVVDTWAEVEIIFPGTILASRLII